MNPVYARRPYLYKSMYFGAFSKEDRHSFTKKMNSLTQTLNHINFIKANTFETCKKDQIRTP